MSNLDGPSLGCDDDNRLLAEMRVVRGEKLPNRVLLKSSWICAAGNGWASIDKMDQTAFFKSIAFAVPSLIISMDSISVSNISLERTGLCGICTPVFPPVYWVTNTENGNLQPIHKPEEVGTYERGLRNQLPAFQVMAKIPPYDKNHKGKLTDMISVRLVMNSSRLAHRALSYLPNIQETLAQNASSITLKAYTEPAHSDSLVFSLQPFSNSIKALGEDLDQVYEQPPNFRPGLSLDKNQLITVSHMVRREKSPKTFNEREDEEEVITGLPLRIVGRAERKVQCSGGIIADAVGAGKTVMTLALIDYQRAHDEENHLRRKKMCQDMGAQAAKATLLIVPEHISKQWVQETVRFLPDLSADDIMVFTSRNQVFSDVDPRKVRSAKLVVISDKIFKENWYREELSKHAGRLELSKTTSERAYRAWYSDCVLQIRRYLSKYLKAKDDDAAKQSLAREIELDFEQVQHLNQQLASGIVKNSSRKGSKDQKRHADKLVVLNNNPKFSSSKMFMDFCILPEFFSWARVVWDEVSYRNIEVAQFLSVAVADHKWLLSGTPPRQNLEDVDYLSRSLGISLVRPIDLRLGLPSITRGPSESIRTDTELCCSYGKLKSDQFVKDRHEQAELFLKDFASSNNASALNVKITERVIVCSLSLLEKAIYLEKQQSWQRAQMLTDNLAAEDLRNMLQDIDHLPGVPFPNDLIPRVLTYSASFPTFGQDDTSLSKICDAREKLLRDTGKTIQLLFQRAVWLGCRLEQCAEARRGRSQRPEELARKKAKRQRKDDTGKEQDEILNLTASLRGLISSLEDGDYQTFGGISNYLGVLKLLVPWQPSLKERNQLLAQLESHAGVDTIALFSQEIKPKPRDRADNGMDILHKFHEQSNFSWSNFYKLDLDDVDAMDEANIFSILQDTLAQSSRHDPSNCGNQEVLQKRKQMTIQQLRQTLKEFLPQIETEQENNRSKYVNASFDESSLAKKSKAGLAVEARKRGLKCPSTANTTTLMGLIKAHENGGAGQKNYDSPSIHTSTPMERPPQLGQTIRIRGSEIPETANTFKETFHLLTGAIRIFGNRGNELRRVKLFQKLQNRDTTVCCQQCKGVKDLIVNLECGHVLCRQHIIGKELCGDGGSHCQAVVEHNSVPLADLLKESRKLDKNLETLAPVSAKQLGKYSSKVNSIIDIIRKISQEDSVVIFSQYEYAIKQIIAALKGIGVVAKTTSNLPGYKSTSGCAADIIEAFKRKAFRVLVLKVDASEASGANLVIANHVIFATPLATSTQDLYETCMEQAKGRCARRGQIKDVFLYHCVVAGTIEVDILETRTKKQVRVQSQRSIGWLVPPGFSDSRLYFLQDYDRKQGDSGRVNSFLRQAEIWKAIGETDLATTIEYSKAVEQLQVGTAPRIDFLAQETWRLGHKTWKKESDLERDWHNAFYGSHRCRDDMRELEDKESEEEKDSLVDYRCSTKRNKIQAEKMNIN